MKLHTIGAVDKYEQGTAYGHIAIGVDDIYAICEAVRASGGKVTREPGPVKGVQPLLPSLKIQMAIKLNLSKIKAQNLV